MNPTHSHTFQILFFTKQIDKHEQMHMFAMRIEMKCVQLGTREIEKEDGKKTQQNICLWLCGDASIMTQHTDGFDFSFIQLITSITNWRFDKLNS